MQSPSAAQESRLAPSSFVTALAWVFIALAGLATGLALLLNLKVWLPSPSGWTGGVVKAFESSPRFFFSLLIICSTMLAAAIGLLMRRNWARILFMGLMGIGAVWALGGGLLFQFILTVGASAGEEDIGVSTASRVGIAAAALALAGLFGWIVHRLRSSRVRAEFSDR